MDLQWCGSPSAVAVTNRQVMLGRFGAELVDPIRVDATHQVVLLVGHDPRAGSRCPRYQAVALP